MFYGSVMFEVLLYLAYGQPSQKKKKKKKNGDSKVTENKVVIKISTHLQ